MFKKKDERFQFSTLIGSSKKRFHEIDDVFMEAVKSSKVFEKAWAKALKNAKIETKEDFMILSFIFGRIVERNHSMRDSVDGAKIVAKLLKDLLK
jgi:hypothetical protein